MKYLVDFTSLENFLLYESCPTEHDHTHEPDKIYAPHALRVARNLTLVSMSGHQLLNTKLEKC